ncbi:MAG TPA: Hsp20/alpha crystallin family protein [Bacteroidia bacterium]|nr:Hsp20/alpha crystallin family protein [Bacteroidia bacterium]
MSLIKRNNGNETSVRTILSDFFDADKFFNAPFFTQEWIPAVNIVDNDKDFQIDLAAPGFKKEDFKINIENGVLNISAETKTETEEKKKNYTRKEFSSESFSRAFTLPENASEEKIDAKYENGVLKLTVAKKVPVALKKKEIAVA